DANNSTCSSSKICYQYQLPNGTAVCGPNITCSLFDLCTTQNKCTTTNNTLCIVNSCCNQPVCMPLSLISLCTQPKTQQSSSGNLNICSGATWNTSIPITVAGGNGAGGSLQQLYYPKFIVFDSSYTIIYISDAYNHRILKWIIGALQGRIIGPNGGQSSSSNQLDYPSCLYLTSDGDLYICDNNNYRIQKMSIYL
ncbi:unnamed protein product, partial [Didymodactylos carnosus]